MDLQVKLANINDPIAKAKAAKVHALKADEIEENDEGDRLENSEAQEIKQYIENETNKMKT